MFAKGIAAPVKKLEEKTYVLFASYKVAAGVFVVVYVKLTPEETVSTTHHPSAFTISNVPCTNIGVFAVGGDVVNTVTTLPEAEMPVIVSGEVES